MLAQLIVGARPQLPPSDYVYLGIKPWTNPVNVSLIATHRDMVIGMVFLPTALYSPALDHLMENSMGVGVFKKA